MSMNVVPLARFAVAGLLSLLALSAAEAQKINFNQGFDARVEAVASGEEITTQPNLFVMQVEFRPMGIVKVDVTDPKTGEKKTEHVWYLVYRAVNRDLETPVDESDTAPQNPRDPLPRPMLVPEFFLIVDDDEDLQIRQDQIIPEAVAAIAEREKLQLKNSVQIVGPIPEAIPADQEQVDWIYGVATWKGIDPHTDHFVVMANGFSNGYTNNFDVAGEKLRARKTILLKYWRPGDEYDQTDDEIRRDPADPKPRWIYRPEGAPKTEFLLPSADAAEPAAPEAPAENN